MKNLLLLGAGLLGLCTLGLTAAQAGPYDLDSGATGFHAEAQGDQDHSDIHIYTNLPQPRAQAFSIRSEEPTIRTYVVDHYYAPTYYWHRDWVYTTTYVYRTY